MKTVVEWFAWSVVGLLGFGLIVLGWAWLLEGLNRRRELALETSRKLGARDAGSQIARLAFWFMEDPNTYWALKEVGRAIADSGHLNPDVAREAWRKKISHRKSDP